MKILMICLGNICRSPIAEGVMSKLIDEKGLDWYVQSAGTSGFHQGDLPHTESIAVSAQHGINIKNQRSQQLMSNHIKEYDLLIVMDQQNYNNTLKLCSTDFERSKVKMLLNYSFPNENRAVPDPYYEGGFENVFSMIEKACIALIKAESN